MKLKQGSMKLKQGSMKLKPKISMRVNKQFSPSINIKKLTITPEEKPEHKVVKVPKNRESDSFELF